MARKKDPQPLCTFKQDMYDSLDNVVQQGIMLIQAADTAVELGGMKPAVAEVLKQRVAAFRFALIGSD